MNQTVDYAADFRARIKKVGASFNLIATAIGRRSSSLSYAITARDSLSCSIMVKAAEEVLGDLEAGRVTISDLRQQVREAKTSA